MTIRDDDDELITRRLARALEAEARRDPLPTDFSVAVAEGLANRRRRGLLSLVALPALAGTLVLAVAVAAVVLSLWRSPISVPPGANGSSPSATAGLAHFMSARGGPAITFDYPADWRIIERDAIMRHYQVIPVVLGTGDWTPNCQPVQPTDGIVSGITCGPTDIFTVGPGQVVVEIYQWNGFGAHPAATPPAGAIRLPTGLWATVTDTGTSSTWQVNEIGVEPPITIEARFADPGAEQLRAAVRSLVESLVITGPAAATAAPDSLPAPTP